ncbi:hypothetical protein F5Y15DRAFT_34768 [Xylariaceae sp. FL0016]|nr:hypothetical protein F5Y15DRAFT_34768 [Xylariaceae sp. FL0016]
MSVMSSSITLLYLHDSSAEFALRLNPKHPSLQKSQPSLASSRLASTTAPGCQDQLLWNGYLGGHWFVHLSNHTQPIPISSRFVANGCYAFCLSTQVQDADVEMYLVIAASCPQQPCTLRSCSASGFPHSRIGSTLLDDGGLLLPLFLIHIQSRIPMHAWHARAERTNHRFADVARHL